MKTSGAEDNTSGARRPSQPIGAQRLADSVKSSLRVGYALRRVPEASLACLVPWAGSPQAGDVALARLEKIGKNAGLELPDGRRRTLHEGDLLAVVFGDRYATRQFEGYAQADGDRCDMLSMGGMCGLVRSKHAEVAEPTRLRLLGSLADATGRPLRLRDFSLPALPPPSSPHVVVVCGTSMDAGKTHTATSLIVGLRRQQRRVAAIKLTGTAAGRDAWGMRDAGASPVLDFVDGGHPSTYLCTLEQLLDLHALLCAHAVAQGADCVVVEIADGLLQRETGALLRSARFTRTVHNWVFATGDPVAGAGGVRLLRDWGIDVDAVSGLIALSPLAMREVEEATGAPCLTSRELEQGKLNARLVAKGCPGAPPSSVGGRESKDGETGNGEPAASPAAGLRQLAE